MYNLELSKTYTIRSFESDCNNRAKLTTLCNLFQDIAWAHADELGYGFLDFKEKGLIWMLSRLKVEMKAFPSWNQEIKIKTTAKGVDGLFALRDFVILNNNNEVLGDAYSSWLILGSKIFRPQRPDFLYENYPKFNPHAYKEQVGKIEAFDSYDELKTLTAEFSQIDSNQHVNNVYYLEWLLNFFNYDFHKINTVKQFSINYLNQVKPGETLELTKKEKAGKRFVFEGFNKTSEKKSFYAEIQFA